MKTFKDLNIAVHKRDFVRNLIGVPIVITNSTVYQRKGVYWLKFICDYTVNNAEGKEVEIKDVLVSTSGELLVEAGRQFNKTNFPFCTTIIINNNGFYEFS